MNQESIDVQIPEFLVASGSWVVRFSIEVDAEAYQHCRCSGRIDGVPGSEVELTGSRLNLGLPGDSAGEVNVIISIVDPSRGLRLTGSHAIEARRQVTGSVHVSNTGQQINGNGLSYNPIEINTDTDAVGAVGPKVSAKISLRATPASEDVPLDDLLSREGVVILSREEGAGARVLQVNVGKQCVVGRCYAGQLEGKARDQLAAFDSPKVHWVTNWDDSKVNRLSLAMTHLPGREARLKLSNITDYSRLGTSLVVRHGSRSQTLRPNKELQLAVLDDNSTEVLLASEGDERRVVCFSYTEVPLGNAAVPVYTTRGAIFRWPPVGTGNTGETMTINFLGLWIPWKVNKLVKFLRSSKQALQIKFSGDHGVSGDQGEPVSLWFRHDARDSLVLVASKQDLKKCMAKG